MPQSEYRTRHEFEDVDGNDIELTEITYEVLHTYADIDPVSEELVFTHVVRIRPASIDLHAQFLGEDPLD